MSLSNLYYVSNSLTELNSSIMILKLKHHDRIDDFKNQLTTGLSKSQKPFIHDIFMYADYCDSSVQSMILFWIPSKPVNVKIQRPLSVCIEVSIIFHHKYSHDILCKMKQAEFINRLLNTANSMNSHL